MCRLDFAAAEKEAFMYEVSMLSQIYFRINVLVYTSPIL